MLCCVVLVLILALRDDGRDIGSLREGAARAAEEAQPTDDRKEGRTHQEAQRHGLFS